MYNNSVSEISNTITSTINNESVTPNMQAQDQGNRMFDGFVSWVENSYFYQKHMSTWGQPLSNPSFDAALLVIIVLILVWAVISTALTIMKHKKIIAANNKNRAKRAKEAEEKVAIDNLVAEYIHFKMTTQSSASDATFDQWLATRTVQTGISIPVNRIISPENQELIDAANNAKYEAKSSVANLLNKFSKAQAEKREDAELDAELDRREKEEIALKRAEEIEEKRLEALNKTESLNINNQVIDKKAEAQAILSKHTVELQATEMVDLPQEKAVSISSVSIVKPLEKNTEKKDIEEKIKETVDINKLVTEKTEEVQSNITTYDTSMGFEGLVAQLNRQKEEENKAKQIEKEAEVAKANNMEILKENLENSYSNSDNDKKVVRQNKNDELIEEAKKKALREIQKEELRKIRKGKMK